MKKEYIVGIVLFLLLVLYSIFSPSGDQLKGRVVKVQDGDTITLLVGSTQHKIRLQGIDCPEKGQPFGTVSTKFTSDSVFGKTVTVEWEEKDRYGRVLGDVIYDGKKSLSEELVKAGLAWHYKQYSKDPVLAALEIKARTTKKGLWADKNPIPPWEWRKQKRKKP
ncbi:MAG: thermonuclease family protein [Candidatus Cloacimonadaceae bacterium]|jgi:endonuclease YncB( thermonuclease family)|nr:thermonuclease family protein [Candidatus Cloacimonadota bacterium]MDX9949854.1 thermonuclease family protein [Candidatus Syntrophosphaera sp.]NLN85942.1 thermonuclease family protein [Candidatus Cloacimonadota bacterium]